VRCSSKCRAYIGLLKLWLTHSLLKRGLQWEETHAPLHFLLGNALASIGDHAAAVKAFEDTIRLCEIDDTGDFLISSLANLANSLDSLGDTKKAIEIRKRASDADPEFIPVRMNHAERAIQQQDFDGAIQICERVIAQDWHCFPAHALLGKALMGKEHFHKAIASFTRAKAIKPGVALLHADLAGAHLDVGDYNAALATYAEGAALPLPDPPTQHDVDIHSHCAFNQGQILCKMGNPFAGIGALQRAIEINPEHLKAYLSLGHTFSQIGRLDDAAATFHTASTIMPARPEPMIEYGILLNKQKNFVAAKAAFESARSAAAILGDGNFLPHIAQCMLAVQSGE
jgi:tetratricopeptide (TPR) repeat protein